MTSETPSSFHTDSWMKGGILGKVKHAEGIRLTLLSTSQTTHVEGQLWAHKNPASRLEGPGHRSFLKVCRWQLELLLPLSFWKVHGDCTASSGATRKIRKKPELLLLSLSLLLLHVNYAWLTRVEGYTFFSQILQTSVW